MKVISIFSALIIVLFLTGCSRPLIPKHPTKSKDEYHLEKKKCEDLARAYAISREDPNFTRDDEFIFVRRCLKTKGWKYRN